MSYVENVAGKALESKRGRGQKIEHWATTREMGRTYGKLSPTERAELSLTIHRDAIEAALRQAQTSKLPMLCGLCILGNHEHCIAGRCPCLCRIAENPESEPLTHA